MGTLADDVFNQVGYEISVNFDIDALISSHVVEDAMYKMIAMSDRDN